MSLRAAKSGVAVFAPKFAQEHKIAAAFFEEWQRVIYVFLIGFCARYGVTGHKLRVCRIIGHIAKAKEI
jgi:hypothetical protein